MTRVTMHEAKTQLSRLVAKARAGEEVVIMKGKEPVARIVPMKSAPPPGPRQPGQLKGKIDFDDRFFEPLPDDELRLWNEGP